MAVQQHGNISVEDEQVSVTLPFDYFGALIATGAYGLILFAMVDDGFPLRRITLPYLVMFVIATLVWGWFMARRRIVTTFDGRERKVYRRNLLGMVKTIDFARIGSVTPVENTGMFSGGGSHYSIKLADDRHGKGYTLTNTTTAANPERVFFLTAALPKIQEMFSADDVQTADGGGTSETSRAATGETGNAVPERTRFFRQRNGVYTRRKTFIAIGATFLGLMMLGSAIVVGVSGKDSDMTSMLISGGLGALLAWFGMTRIAKVELDTQERKIRMCNWLGFRRKRSYDFTQFSGFNSTRHYTNGIYTGTELSMCFVDGSSEPSLASALRTKKLTAFSEEVEQIIFGTLYPNGVVEQSGDEEDEEESATESSEQPYNEEETEN